MKILIALAAAGLLATTASAQSTMSTTQKTTVVHKSTDMPVREKTTVVHKSTEMPVSKKTMVVHKTMVMPDKHHAHRVCHTHWRHHHKIRTCRTTRW